MDWSTALSEGFGGSSVEDRTRLLRTDGQFGGFQGCVGCWTGPVLSGGQPVSGFKFLAEHLLTLVLVYDVCVHEIIYFVLFTELNN